MNTLRIAPAALTAWGVALIGVHGSLRWILALMGILLIVGLLLLRATLRAPGASPRRAPRALLAHGAVIALATAMQLPALAHSAQDLDLWEGAASSGAVVSVTVRTDGALEPAAATAPWSSERLQGFASTVPGTQARIGRETVHLTAPTRMLVQATERPGPVRTDREVTVTGTVVEHDGLLILRAQRLHVHPRQAHWRDHLQDRARAATAELPGDTSALVRGMTTGDTFGMAPDTEEQMRRAGLSHLVAVSGANIALVLATVLLPLMALGVRRRPRIVLGAVAAALYVVLVGHEPSVLRAATMAGPLLLARLLGHPLPALHALVFALGAWSIWDPLLAASVGFVLSVLATAAILLLAPRLAEGLSALLGGRVPAPLLLVLTVPLCAQLLVTPVLILLTPEVSLWAVPANMLAAPLVGPTTMLGMAGLVVSPLWPQAGNALYAAAGGGAHLVLGIAGVADGLPGSRVPVPAGVPGALLAAAVISAAALLWALRHHRLSRWIAAACTVALLAPILIRHAPVPLPGPDWRIAACDVGQGDAVLLRGGTSSPRTVLIDTGPDPAALSACLHTLQVERIDLLVLTHPHADHTGGRDALTGSLAPIEQWVCPLPEAAGQVAAGTPAVTARRGVEWRPGDELTLEVLWPVDERSVQDAAAREKAGSEDAARNACSLVVRARWPDGMSYVGLGDLEPAAQRALTQLAPGQGDVVKAAHHGSARQHEPLYAQLSPRHVLFTVGEENTFGHPTPKTLAMSADLGAEVHRTDTEGLVLLGGGGGSAPPDRVGPAPGSAHTQHPRGRRGRR